MFKNCFRSDILFSGYYGHMNTGDDAFVEVASWGAKKYWNKNNNVFLGKKGSLPIVCEKLKGYPFEIPKSYSFQSRVLLSSTDLLISAGGSTLHSEFKASNIKKIAIDRKEKGSNIRIGGIGVSVGPFKTAGDERAVFDYLKGIDFLAVRDQASFDIVKSLDLPYQPVNAFDLAALLPDIYGTNMPVEKPAFKKIIGVSVCPFESIVNRNDTRKEGCRNSKIIDLLKIIELKGDVHFKFFVINGHPDVGDLELTKKTIREVSPASYEVLTYNRQTRIVWDEIASCDFLISTRLHAAIFACFSNTPFLLNEYHKKCGDFLENVAYDEEFRAGDANFEPKEKALEILEILNGDKNYVSPRQTSEMKEQAKLNFTGVGV